MEWNLHAGLEIFQTLAILALAITIIVILQRLKGHVAILNQIPELVAQLSIRENVRSDEILVGQAVMLRRLQEIERRLEK